MIKYKILQKYVYWEQRCSVRTNRRTDCQAVRQPARQTYKTKTIVVLCNIANQPKRFLFQVFLQQAIR